MSALNTLELASETDAPATARVFDAIAGIKIMRRETGRASGR